MVNKFISAIYLLICVFVLTSSMQGGYKVGDKISNFTLKNVDGEDLSLEASIKDSKGAIVIFTCNTCPYSKLYEDRIIELHKVYEPKGYPVIAINPNDVKRQPGDSFKEMVKRAEDKSFPFPYLYDESQDIAKRFGAARTPHVYIVKKEKKDLVLAYIGAVDNNSKGNNITEFYVKDAIDALLKEKDVLKTKTKAIGCTIKWRKS